MVVFYDEIPGVPDTLCDGAGPVALDEVRAALFLRGERAGILLLDVRGRAEFAAGHVRGAFSVPGSDVFRLLPLLPKGRCFVTYGRDASDAAAARAAAEFAARGFPARAMAGGFEEWHAEGLPIHRGIVPSHQVRCACVAAAVPPPSALRVG